jgi:hypothetical protein
VIGDHIFVTSGKNISIYDISDPAKPKALRGTRSATPTAWPPWRPTAACSSITEQGYFLSLGSSSSSPKWAGKDDVLYSIDYARGIDILRWKGEHYVPGAAAEAGRVRGTGGETTPPAPNAAQVLKRTQLARTLAATGWSPGVCRLAAQRS